MPLFKIHSVVHDDLLKVLLLCVKVCEENILNNVSVHHNPTH